MKETLREKIIRINRNHDKAEQYLKQFGCSMCPPTENGKQPIFTNELSFRSGFVGYINADFEIDSIDFVKPIKDLGGK